MYWAVLLLLLLLRQCSQVSELYELQLNHLVLAQLPHNVSPPRGCCARRLAEERIRSLHESLVCWKVSLEEETLAYLDVHTHSPPVLACHEAERSQAGVAVQSVVLVIAPQQDHDRVTRFAKTW